MIESCTDCGVEFTKRTNWQKFCSLRCKERHRPPQILTPEQQARKAANRKRWCIEKREKHRATQKAWADRNQEKVKEYQRRSVRKRRLLTGVRPHRTSAEQDFWYEKLHRYGITRPQYERMLVSQGFSCAICLEPFNQERRTRGPFVDHDHVTGFVRGLLCNACNFLLGLYGDSDGRLKIVLLRAIGYLNQEQKCEKSA